VHYGAALAPREIGVEAAERSTGAATIVDRCRPAASGRL
jgi:hypothetical protein